MTQRSARRTTFRAATVVALSMMALSIRVTGPLAITPAFAGPAEAPCTPTALPTFGGPDGSLMWITTGGLYVGGADTTNQHDDGSPIFAAAYWTNDDFGYHINALPHDPLVDDEVLDVNESNRMID